MTLLIWLLAYPVVAAACVWMYATETSADIGRLNAGYASVYALGTVLLVLQSGGVGPWLTLGVLAAPAVTYGLYGGMTTTIQWVSDHYAAD